MKSRKFLLVLNGLLILLFGFMPAVAQASQQVDVLPNRCALLDDPAVRPIMSGMMETTLLVECGRSNELGQVKAPEAQPVGGAPLLGTDVQVNSSAGESGATQTQSETSLVVNGNTGTICSAFNDSYSGVIQGQGYASFSNSTNGGVSFTDRGSFGSRSFGDPSLIWRQLDGNFYFSSIDSSGGLNIFRSTDDCTTFQFLALGHTGFSDDKELLAVDNNPTSSFYGRMYLVWTNFGAGGRINATFSDNGTSWSAAVPLSTSGITVQGAWPTVAPDGTVYVGWVRWDPYFTGPISIEIAKSTNGGASWALVTDPMAGKTNPYLNSAQLACGRPALNGNIRYLPSPQVTVGPDGVLHAVYSYDPDTRGVGDVVNVYYRRSLDGGTTWQPEIMLNDDGTLLDQFFPTVSTNEGSRVISTWYDRRLDAGNLLFTYWMRVSEDGGATWGPSQQVSDVPSPVYLDPNLATCYHGDYDQQKQTGDTAYIQWSDDHVVRSGHNDPDVWFDMNAFGGGGGCTTACLRVSNIVMRAAPTSTIARVTVVDENGAVVSGAAVTVHWDYPGGTADQTRNTNANGLANFRVLITAAGSYTITVTNITKAGSTFDPDGSTILTRTITR